MVFLATSLLRRLRQAIQKVDSVQPILDLIKEMPESTAELIVTDAIELWQQNGSPGSPGSNTDCFKTAYDQNYKPHYQSNNKASTIKNANQQV